MMAIPGQHPPWGLFARRMQPQGHSGAALGPAPGDLCPSSGAIPRGPRRARHNQGDAWALRGHAGLTGPRGDVLWGWGLPAGSGGWSQGASSERGPGVSAGWGRSVLGAGLSLRGRQGPVHMAGAPTALDMGAIVPLLLADPGDEGHDAGLVAFLLQASRHTLAWRPPALSSPLPSGLFPLALGLTSPTPLLSVQAPRHHGCP